MIYIYFNLQQENIQRIFNQKAVIFNFLFSLFVPPFVYFYYPDMLLTKIHQIVPIPLIPSPAMRRHSQIFPEAPVERGHGEKPGLCGNFIQ